MSLAQTVAEVLAKHVVLEVESIDRMHLNVYVPQLQAIEGAWKLVRIHRGHKVALHPGLGTVLPELSPPNSSLRHRFDRLDQEITSWIEHTKLAA